ncbi:purine-binding chemotaxis protein CheW [Stigmatella aurantiaca]|uniref:Purine-binding chemotaxis protein CheW n=3 Tax=Archangiaceae TaxID=39 RepID=A0A1H7WIL6_STIAU|nr:purine-binding chemotaxis protein CheW [Stigmatella aurantiaca]SEU02266.1 purine-binding chemotaxis protein CheW [Stigmatella erecta]
MSEVMMFGGAEEGRFLIVRARGWICALPIAEVVETMRPLPVTPVAEAPPFVRGVAIVRGRPSPVVHLATLLGGTRAGTSQRFVSLRVGERQLVLEVEEVLGLRRLGARELGSLPPLLAVAVGGNLEVLGTLDGQLLAALNTSRLLTEAVWGRLVTGGEA